MIKVFEIILCMYLKTISPRCGWSLHLYVLFITDQYKKKIGQAILVGKCCHCRIKFGTVPTVWYFCWNIFNYFQWTIAHDKWRQIRFQHTWLPNNLILGMIVTVFSRVVSLKTSSHISCSVHFYLYGIPKYFAQHIIRFSHHFFSFWSLTEWVIVVKPQESNFSRELESQLTLWVRTRSGKVYSMQHYVIKFVSDLRQVSGFLHQ